MLKWNNNIKIELTDAESDFLIELMNEKFEINSLNDAISYCIRKQMNCFKKELSEN